MGTPLVGDVVLIAFPYSDLSQSQGRSALVVADMERGDDVLCRITSKPCDDPHALTLNEVDFSGSGFRRYSFVRVGRLITANEVLILGIAGHLTGSKLAEDWGMGCSLLPPPHQQNRNHNRGK